MLKPWAVTALVAAVALIGLSFVKTGESVADWAASGTSVATERQNADEFIAESELARAFASEDDPAQRMTNSMGQRLVAALAPASRYQYRFRVVNSNEVNAFALPGGDIVVHKGLFRIMTRPEQLAAVLAHEIQHVERQHGLRSSYRAMSLGAILVWTFGITTDGGVEMVHSLKQNKYARSLETEADLEGAELLMRAGINRQHMVDMLNLLAKQHTTKVPAWLSDHPDPAARAVRVASGR